MNVSEIRTRLVKDIVIEEGALAHLFESYGIDYCCHGDETMEAVCERKGLELEAVAREMARAKAARPYSFLHCELWSDEFLIEYIVQNHHRYLKATIPVILTQLARLVREHGEKYPYLKLVQLLFEQGTREIEQHMRKEEMILFPYIKSLASAVEFNRRRPMTPFLNLDGPITKMHNEHLEIAQVLSKIRALLSDYKIPKEACALHRTVVTAVQAFTKDVHQHVHLENNILFPRAVALEALFDQRTGHLLPKPEPSIPLTMEHATRGNGHTSNGNGGLAANLLSEFSKNSPSSLTS